MSDQIKEPHPHDVLSGKGNNAYYHDGNEFFRKMVREMVREMVRDHKVYCPKGQKGIFSKLIVDKIKQRNPPGRFLKQAKDSKVWYDIGEKKSIDKTRHALREEALELMQNDSPGIRLNLLNSSVLEERRKLQDQHELGMALQNHQMMIVRRAAAYTPNEIPYFMLQQHQQQQHHQQYQGQQHTHQLNHISPSLLRLQQSTSSLPLLPHLSLPSLLRNLPSNNAPMYDSARLNSQILELQQNLTSEGNDNVVQNVATSQQKLDNETDEEYKIRLKKRNLLHCYRLMLFSYSNNKYNPPFLQDEKEFKKAEFPIRMTDDRVFDRFVEWVLAVKFDQFTNLPLDKTAHVDHMHGLPGYFNHSRDGMFRCLCSSSTNTLIGIIEGVIAANSNCSEGTADITAPYDISNPKNTTFLADITNMLTVIIPALKKDWKEAPAAKIARDEESRRRERFLSNRNKKSQKQSQKTFRSGEWSKKEKEKILKGLSERGWGQWTPITRHYISTRSNRQCKNWAEATFTNKEGFLAWKDDECFYDDDDSDDEE